MKETIDLKKIAAFMIIIALLLYGLVVAKNLILPLIFGALFALVQLPVLSFFSKYIKSEILGVSLSFITSILPLATLVLLLSMQSAHIYSELPDFKKKIESGFQKMAQKIDSRFGIDIPQSEEGLGAALQEGIDEPVGIISSGVSVSTSFLGFVFLTLVYSFLILLYRRSFLNFYLYQFRKENRLKAAKTFDGIKIIVQKYLVGLLLVVFILSVLNGIGLWIIGIKHALFLGFLAGFLAIIPYIGTFVGGLIPFAYAFATTDTYVTPLIVVIMFIIIQFIEGNFITPKVVGSQIALNPLAALVGLFFGGFIWGMAGLILSLPLLAIFRVVCMQIDILKPIGVLISDKIMAKEDVFEEKYALDKFRLLQYFKK